MVKVQFKDGQTLSFDLFKDSDLSAWKNFSNGPSWQQDVTAIGLHQHKVFSTLPAPNHGIVASGFGAGLVFGENGKTIGEKVWYEVNDLTVSLIAYRYTKVTKFGIERSEV